MSKSKVPPITPEPQVPPGPQTVPLKDITITWPARSWWTAGPSTPRTITGGQLAVVLEDLANHHTGDFEEFTKPTDQTEFLILELEGFREMLQALGTADFDDPEAVPAIFSTLADHVRRMTAYAYAARVYTRDEYLAKATVTIGAPAPTAVA